MIHILSNVLLGRRNDAANRWLEENPAVLGGGAILLGSVIAYFGVVGLMRGKTSDKWGNQMSGGMSALVSIVRLLAGLGLLGFGIYVLIFGAP